MADLGTILCAGDSITTSGFGSDADSYRTPLAAALTAAGHTFTLEVHAAVGWTVNDMGTGIAAEVTADDPATVLIHIGSNDLWAGTAQDAADDVEAVIAACRGAKATVDIVLAEIIPYDSSETARNAKITTYNGLLRDLAAAYDTPSARVVTVDCNAGFTDAMLIDDVHPNDDGDAHIAAAMLDGIEAVYAVDPVTVWRAASGWAVDETGTATWRAPSEIATDEWTRSAGTALTVDSARAPSRVDTPTLTQATPLAVEGSRALARADTATLTQASDLVVDGARAAARADTPELAQTSPLTVDGARATARADRPLLAVSGGIVVEGARATSRADSPTLTQHAVLTVDGARAPSRADTPNLGTASTLIVDGARAVGRADAPVIEQSQPLTVAGARATSRADAPLLVAAGTVPVQSARAPARADSPLLTQHTVLVVADARAVARADSPVVESRNLLIVHDARAPGRADTPLVDHHSLLTVQGARAPARADQVILPGAPLPPPERTVYVAADHRTLRVPHDNRTVTA